MIKCRAIINQMMFVTAKGEILPCPFVYRGGPELNDDLKKIIEEENFDSLSKSWTTDNPYRICKLTCDDKSTHPFSIKNFDKQWKNSNINNT